MSQLSLVILGGTGDLSKKKLLPALYRLFCKSVFDQQTKIVLVSADSPTIQQLRDYIFESLIGCRGVDDVEQERDKQFVELFSHYHLNLGSTEIADWNQAYQYILESAHIPALYYLAAPPELYENIIFQLQRGGQLAGANRIAIEKPFGKNGDAARRLEALLSANTKAGTVQFIDHYLGKETVQNLLALRFANALFEPVWRKQCVDHVQITVAEEIGVDERWAYYGHTGALRDMVQNHLLQLLCLVAMEPPASMCQGDIQGEKVKVIRALRRITPEQASLCTVRGTYLSKAASADHLLDDTYTTETYVAIKAHIDNWRWRGTPFYLRTGKRLAAKVSEIVVQFRGPDHVIFPSKAGLIKPNKLVIRLQPDEGIKLILMAKTPGWHEYQLCEIPLNLSFPETFGADFPGAYERLFAEIIGGRALLTPHIEEILEAWRWVDEIGDSWSRSDCKLDVYQAGSWGPVRSDQLLAQDQRTWVNG